MIGWFLPQKSPAQYLLAGEKSLTVLRPENRRLEVKRQLDGVALADVAGEAAALAPDLLPLPTGLLLSPAHFIFHIFEFDRLPWPRTRQRELVEWKLQKAFPENIDLYDHRFFRLDRRRVLSILVRRSLLEKAAELFAGLRMEPTVIGSTTVCLLNRVSRRGAPDLLVEIDGSVLNLLFLRHGRPVYVRRSKTASTAEYAGEIAKTVQYAASSQGLQPRRFQVAALGPDAPDLGSAAELADLGLTALPALPPGAWIPR